MIKLPDFEANYPSIRGQGMSVAIIDDGFDLNNASFGPDLNSNGISDRITFQYDFADNDAIASTPLTSGFSHGTFVASLVAGADRTSEHSTFRGIAPQANIIALKVAKDNAPDAPQAYAILSAMDWVIANAANRSIVAVNLSIGGGNYAQASFR